eukprot:1045198-Lingulodinium_polyedra.AAC.1
MAPLRDTWRMGDKSSCIDHCCMPVDLAKKARVNLMEKANVLLRMNPNIIDHVPIHAQVPLTVTDIVDIKGR